MVKVIFIAGVPASGKSTLVRRLLERYAPDGEDFRYGLVRGKKKGNVSFVGVFDGTIFEGTDKLSMVVINDAIKYVDELSGTDEKNVVILEGDRLFNQRFILTTKATLILIDADHSVLVQRHMQRGDNQNETFLKSRRTKIENFASKFKVKRVYNNTIEDGNRIFSAICNLIERNL